MQIKREHGVYGTFISSGARDTVLRRGGEWERRNEGFQRSKRSPLSRSAGRTPEVKRAGTLFIITKLLPRARCERLDGCEGEVGKNCARQRALRTPATTSCPNRARPLKRDGCHRSFLLVLVTRALVRSPLAHRLLNARLLIIRIVSFLRVQRPSANNKCLTCRQTLEL